MTPSHSKKLLKGSFTLMMLVLFRTALGAPGGPAISQALLYNNENKQCAVTSSRNDAVIRECGSSFNEVIITSLPSTGTLLLTSNDCTKTVSDQNWWVKVQATALVTSSKKMSMSGLLAETQKWLEDPRHQYAAPNLKIVGREIKRLTDDNSIGCAIISPAVRVQDDAVKVKFTPRKDSINVSPSSSLGTCDNQIMAGVLTIPLFPFRYQCVTLSDGKSDYELFHFTNVIFLSAETAKYCPENQVVVGYAAMWSNSDADRLYILSCASVRKPSTGQVLKISSTKVDQGWHGYQSFTYCRLPLGGAFSAFTGMDVDFMNGGRFKFYCSAFENDTL